MRIAAISTADRLWFLARLRLALMFATVTVVLSACGGGGTPFAGMFGATSTLQVTIAAGAGTVTSVPSGINCSSGTCSGAFPTGMVVQLTATPAGGYGLHATAPWGGACSGTGNHCTVTVNANKTATVTFSQTFMLQLSGITGAGTVTSSPGGITCAGPGLTGTCSATFASGAVVTLTGSPGVSFAFANWGGNCSGIVNTCNLTMTAIRTVSATFTSGSASAVRVSVAGEGTVTEASTSFSCDKNGGAACSASLPIASTVVATPAGGYTFAGWGGDCSGTGTCTVLAGTRNLTAFFSPVVSAPAPYLIYTDIVSGPITGGENNKGIYLSVFGKNFGSTGLGTDVKVYLNNIEVDNYRNTHVTAAPAIGPSRARQDIQQISVQVGSAGSPANGAVLPIKVVANGRVSNTNLSFTVNPGTIYFVSTTGNDTTGSPGNIALPYRTVQKSGIDNGDATCSASSGMQTLATAGVWGLVRPGDFIVMRGGTWTDVSKDLFFLRTQNKSGKAPTGAVDTGPITIMGYPGETPYIYRPWGSASDYTGGGISGADTTRQTNNGCGGYITIVNLKIETGRADGPINTQNGASHRYGQSWRVVNSEMSGISCQYNTLCKGGGVAGAGLGNYWVGNYVHDMYDLSDASTSFENHGFYMEGNGSYEVAYNRIENIYGGNGIQTNGTAPTTGGDYSVPNANIHHNIVKGVGKHCINIGNISSTGIVVANNIVYNCDVGGIRFSSDQLSGAKVYNNTVYNTDRLMNGSNSARAALMNDGTISSTAVEIRNNIFVPGTATKYYQAGSVGFAAVAAKMSNNLWYNGRGSVSGSANVTLNPQFVSTTTDAENFHLQAGSPAIDSGTNSVSATVLDDYDVTDETLGRTMRPQGSGYDIGAFEYH